jgi:hypothetical protein
MNITIPADLAGVSTLLTSRHWERAAIVHAYCEPQPGKRTSGENTRGRLTFDEFAHHGIAGLRTRKTVAAYWHGWQSAIDAQQAKPVEPGDTIEEPDMPWPSAAEEEPAPRHFKPLSLARRLTKDAAELTQAEIGPDEWPAVIDAATAVIKEMQRLIAAGKAQAKLSHPAGKARAQKVVA